MITPKPLHRGQIFLGIGLRTHLNYNSTLCCWDSRKAPKVESKGPNKKSAGESARSGSDPDPLYLRFPAATTLAGSPPLRSSFIRAKRVYISIVLALGPSKYIASYQKYGTWHETTLAAQRFLEPGRRPITESALDICYQHINLSSDLRERQDMGIVIKWRGVAKMKPSHQNQDRSAVHLANTGRRMEWALQIPSS
ncbi:uncharacterized protein H6S33_009752 [Morchella sextelata]|uniref:uncharacterized protein n=1 Tax=Morchella sextelata TaxID=1174677 RepID=UPI001D04D73A|nr:uncharacterized protein H6S33_009752 [Morchella sextelata]KAH0613372.1 hypothetical protein H6S33_009752 [Morchella sextelata]